MNQLVCRLARRDDVAGLFKMIRELAMHEGDGGQVLTDERALTRAGFDEPARFGAVLAELDGELAGFVSYTWHYAIWRDATQMNIDDVYVRAAYRGQGVGEAMMRYAQKLAAGTGASRLRWEAKPVNTGAIRFYERLGAAMRMKSVFFWSCPQDGAAGSGGTDRGRLDAEHAFMGAREMG